MSKEEKTKKRKHSEAFAHVIPPGAPTAVRPSATRKVLLDPYIQRQIGSFLDPCELQTSYHRQCLGWSKYRNPTTNQVVDCTEYCLPTCVAYLRDLLDNFPRGHLMTDARNRAVGLELGAPELMLISLDYDGIDLRLQSFDDGKQVVFTWALDDGTSNEHGYYDARSGDMKTLSAWCSTLLNRPQLDLRNPMEIHIQYGMRFRDPHEFDAVVGFLEDRTIKNVVYESEGEAIFMAAMIKKKMLQPPRYLDTRAIRVTPFDQSSVAPFYLEWPLVKVPWEIRRSAWMQPQDQKFVDINLYYRDRPSVADLD